MNASYWVLKLEMCVEIWDGCNLGAENAPMGICQIIFTVKEGISC
jgi:hypothetical protein